MRRLIAAIGLTALSGFALSCVAHAACAPGDFTNSQAAQGKVLYDANCASCHMTDLSGGSGPALGGAKFKSYLDFTKITGAQLLSFITAQMPYQAPGSLKPAEYQSIFAYILQKNQYKAGDAPLTDQTAACIAMLPYPGKS
ncbi:MULTISPECIES: c-type cytochrome [Acidiphilium]|uniref:c-type cytochrome n=1 Tax=Acidiphilium TaxID=522 RepID=UPI000494C241|nr:MULTISPECIES: cytochrome c [Acidiphilium]MBW4034085.1 cytochrome c [Pseudomonadota bacterium]